MPRVGLEPTRLAAPDFESGASTNSTTRAHQEDMFDSGFVACGQALLRGVMGLEKGGEMA